MATVKTAISLRETLFEQASILAREMDISRSRLFALALEEFLARYENRQLLEQINHAIPESVDEQDSDRLGRMRRLQRSQLEGEW